MTPSDIHRHFEENEIEAIFYDGYDEALVGIAQRCGQPDLPVYSREKIVDIIMERDGCEYDEAQEFVDFNIAGGWLGENTPVLLFTP